MDRDTYFHQSSLWLVEATVIADLAIAATRAMSPTFEVPKRSTWDDGPFLTSGKGDEMMDAVMPLIIKTSIEAAKAAEIAMGANPTRASNGGVAVPFVDGKSFRTGAVISRSGIIAQFELWKSFAEVRNYPVNKKQADQYPYFEDGERACLQRLTDRRNQMTHEPDTANAPDLRELVEYVWECHDLARVVDERHPMK